MKQWESVTWPMVGIYRRRFHRDTRESVICGVKCPKDLVGHESQCYDIQRGHLEVLNAYPPIVSVYSDGSMCYETTARFAMRGVCLRSVETYIYIR